ncbi:MAG TPA: outer membrane beta-barrel protein [Flavisolibacter sp.]|nr:outer membrane beta-barrel protein [Flavisolibacter sp.]
MQTKTTLLLSLFFFCITGPLYSQAPIYKLSGHVVGEGDKALPQATVALLNYMNKTVAETFTDSTGRFSLDIKTKDSCRLVISSTGYRVYQSLLFVPEGKDIGTVMLSPLTQAMQEVVIQSKQNPIEVSSETITYNVAKSIDAHGTSALDVLRKAPGVYVNPDNTITLNGKAGVSILMDGKQTYLSGKEIADLLKATPASGIKSIEIINSPTAKYDASGSSGIINIKTNKSQVKGFNGTATTGVAYGVYVKQNQDLSFNYRKGNYNLYGSYNHFVGNYSYLYGSDRLQSGKAYNSFTDDIDKRKKMGARLGLDYNIDKKNTIGFLVNSNFIFGGGITRTNTAIGPPQLPTIENQLYAENDYYYQQTNRYNFNVNYKFEDSKGRLLNLDADYGYFKKGNGNLQSNIYSDAQNQPLNKNFYHSLNDIQIDLKAFKLDYTTNLLTGTLETGIKYSTIASDNEARFFYRLPHEDSLDERRTNVFGFKETIKSGYVNYKKTIGKWSLQGGLRLEEATSKGNLHFKSVGKDSTSKTPLHYLNLFPSLNVSIKPAQAHSVSLAYSRRIDRPAYQDLNPFIYLLDELSFWQGNPYLQPQLTHRATLQYVFKNTTVIGLSYANTDQYSTHINDTLETIKMVMIPRNLGIQKNTSLFLTHTYSPKKWWEMTFNGTLYHLHNKIKLNEHHQLKFKQLASRISLQQRFKLFLSLTGEVSGYFNTKRLTGANELSRGTSQVDIGLQRALFMNKAVIRLAVSDIYKGSKGYSRQRFESFALTSYSYYETRQVRINFTYKFADSSVKGPRSRSSALDNENGRIK